MDRYTTAATAFLAALALAVLPLDAQAGRKFSADMTGIGGSAAKGEAAFELSDDGKTLHYSVVVSGIENPNMSHIHIAPEGKDGPVAAWLYPSGPPARQKDGKFDGKLSEGDLTAASLKGPLEGKALSDLIAKIEAGEAYANVHTQQKPGGEIRGQIKPR